MAVTGTVVVTVVMVDWFPAEIVVSTHGFEPTGLPLATFVGPAGLGPKIFLTPAPFGCTFSACKRTPVRVDDEVGRGAPNESAA